MSRGLLVRSVEKAVESSYQQQEVERSRKEQVSGVRVVVQGPRAAHSFTCVRIPLCLLYKL